MNLIVIGLNHRTAPVEIRERLAVLPSKLDEATRALLAATPLDEATILSTCNRVEIYGVTRAEPRAAVESVRNFLRSHHQCADAHDDHFYAFHNRGVVSHLFRVACGLDSMVVGESEILGQVKDAYRAAHAARATGTALNALFQTTLHVAKQIRTRTAIGRGSTSVGSVAIDLAEKIFGDLGARTVMILGAGKMSEATARALRNRGAKSVIVSNRSIERAQQLADELGGRAVKFEDWAFEFPKVDIVISSTAAPHAILTREKLAMLMPLRQNRPLFLIDIAVPRDIERDAGELENVFLYDIDDLQAIANENLAARQREIDVCNAMVDEHVEKFLRRFMPNTSDAPQFRPVPQPNR
jgi:glutamyl-tRNA reductase